ncbi:MAG: TRAP transporter substrate-binding protein DctP [Roseofilum sp. SBFL]|uniref:TRAP transporter substrate-binding protein n=1 Tax=unclassified Roseofilum TaxID=2620099 RepID=UPI001B0919FD|nr:MULTISPECIES: TRAP transporter substrate-binding protein DctP [unclassified Roseofilum]MBP0013110.1 TRAP transporter substrate-binding protein DctP [Roseofilum sp. SID3]MBP0023722.1 TRAP transporter substrate-binding protein DctP [Roseofilum sp. SID2]MBP0036794.1 TRAP transporter substrate-binding protein DctP [Roseofilum sp. SID1]MBP0042584.1 TRAP transporter substrate-binding protein DctP [Roseofilum sp. SBFL]
MKRRHFIHTSATALTGAAALGSCSQPDQQSEPIEPDSNVLFPVVQWRMATSWSKALNIVFGSAETLSRRVKEMTGGRFVIIPYGGGELVPPLEILDAVGNGTVECGHSGGAYYIEKNRIFGIDTLPFGMNSQQLTAWLYRGGGLDLLQDLYADYGVINFPAGQTGVQMGGWFREKVSTPADFKGLKMRIPGAGAQVMSRLGVEPVTLSSTEVFSAMESGELDAAEFSGPFDDENLGIYHVAPYYYYPGWWETSFAFQLYVNLEAWNQLPSIYQEIFKAAAIETHVTTLAHYDTENGAALKRLISRGTELLPFSEEILNAAYAIAIELQEEMAAQDPGFKAVYDHWRAFRNNISGWHAVSELSYANFAFNRDR